MGVATPINHRNWPSTPPDVSIPQIQGYADPPYAPRMTDRPEPLSRWHHVVDTQDPVHLEQLLGDDCVFRSPAVHNPQEGKVLTTAYLTAAMVVLGPTLRYRHEWWDDDSAVLEFTADLDGRTAHGIDMLTLGQYLAPSSHHLPVRRYVHPDTFRLFEAQARAMGFAHAAVGALVRSSYHADQQAAGAGIS